ncbi:MAG TPA: zinc-dependent metalloprotease, partial [Patescibacteria group bacterium]|nr:zinc-dependent metalloprotease [Patescibacteria group bacterium]
MLVGFAAVAAVEVVRPRSGPAELIDWRQVRDIAQRGLRPAGSGAVDLDAAQKDYRRLARGLEGPLLRFVGGLPRGAVLPDFIALDRDGWLELNLTILRRAVDSVVEAGRLPNSLLVQVGRQGIDRYTGYTLGFLGRRVLGQYDPRLLSPDPADRPGLYLVEPNVEEWRRTADLPQEDLRRWLILHEMTHAWQFAAHPWLRDHMERALRSILESVAPSRSPLERVAAFAGVMPSQWRVVREVQAAMS